MATHQCRCGYLDDFSRACSRTCARLQTERYKGLGFALNCAADAEVLERFAAPDAPGKELLLAASEKLRASARGYRRILRVARTLADLDRSATVRRVRIAEALSYRRVAPGR
jgi:magnesium chelatase family protein